MRRALRFLIGLVAGLLLWSWLAEPYDVVLAGATQPLVRLDHRLRDAVLVARADRIDVTSNTGTIPPVNIPATQLTFNVILLVALFAMTHISRRNLTAFAISFAIVLLLHPPGLLISIESTYATRIPGWSGAHYGENAANAWLMGELIWRLAIMFGIPFGCWWAAREG